MHPSQASRVQSAAPVTHYENFPVASVLCPAHLRPAVAAIYHFARTADDLADEGDASRDERLRALTTYRSDLLAVTQGQSTSNKWPQVFLPLAEIIKRHKLPLNLLTDLLDAFEQDVCFTFDQRRYANDAELLDYCRRSANPIGRLLLHLYDITDPQALAQSDQICTALQLINFWQDVSVDLPRQRWYPSTEAMHAAGVTDADLQPGSHSESARQLIATYSGNARAKMLKGAQLCHRLPGRAGWELRLVVQGGLRILDKIEQLQFATWRTRPRLTTWDVPLMLWRGLRMRPTNSADSGAR
ncbi:MAG: squalene synthase HpnC [Rhodoferax sp.]|nr:squalene synthase HpnC [Rhodoferax sp.]